MQGPSNLAALYSACQLSCKTINIGGRGGESWRASVTLISRLLARWPKNQGFIFKKAGISIIAMSRQALRSREPPVRWVPWKVSTGIKRSRLEATAHLMLTFQRNPAQLPASLCWYPVFYPEDGGVMFRRSVELSPDDAAFQRRRQYFLVPTPSAELYSYILLAYWLIILTFLSFIRNNVCCIRDSHSCNWRAQFSVL
jgi:hypothetical protein